MQKRNPQHNIETGGQALHKMAVDHHMRGDLRDAERAYREAIKTGYIHSAIFSNLGVICKNSGRTEEAILLYQKAIRLDPNNPDAQINLGNLYKELGDLDQALASTLKSLKLKPDNPDTLMNLSVIYKDLGEFDHALVSTLKFIELKSDNPIGHMNLGVIYQRLGQLDHARASTLKSLELKPDNHIGHMNLGVIYKRLGQIDHALASTLKALELKPDNPDALVNLGGIYQRLGQHDHALASTLKALDLKPDNVEAIHNLKGFIDQLTVSEDNAQNLRKAYEILINLNNISHNKLSKIFIHIFLETIQEAAKFDPIISANNSALDNLAADSRLRRSLTLLIPAHQAIEQFLTRLRKELLVLATKQMPIQENLKVLTEALASQCFLNEYVYAQSEEEERLFRKAIQLARKNRKLFNQYLAITACYEPINQLNFDKSWLKNFPSSSEEIKTLIQTQLEEPEEEKRIKASMRNESKTTDAVSVKVQKMYEANPYPRYRYADHVEKSMAHKICKAIGIESTKQTLQFSEVLTSNHSNPKVLIAGCGTGNQVITASRYRNTMITAIDLSSSSLAYAIRKAKEYGMDNVNFRQLDLLDIAALNETFDTIECSGVLHHMEDPAKGLSALNRQLKPGGYIKLGLYSEIARQDIVKARIRIKQLGMKSTAGSIREFRKQVLEGKLKELAYSTTFSDFYSLSMCRDLCFHVQEHRFTTGLLQEFLATEKLIFCGFRLLDSVKKTYQQQFPSDTDMTSLENWGKYEKQNPSTFKTMYQFWAHKPA